MQHGCMQRISCKRGLDVWQFRWPETTHDGRRLHRKKVVGSVTGLRQSELFGLKWGISTLAAGR
jgi:hypothetical protein